MHLKYCNDDNNDYDSIVDNNDDDSDNKGSIDVTCNTE